MARTIHLGCWVEYQGKACVVLDSCGSSSTSPTDPASVDLWSVSPVGYVTYVGMVERRAVRVLLSTPDLSALATSVMESSHAPA